jgi:hypothetical protein
MLKQHLYRILITQGIPDISLLKSTTSSTKSCHIKHQISAFNSCFPQLLFHSPPATAASQQLQPKQTDPKSLDFVGK